MHLDTLAAAVRDGVVECGLVGMRFNTIGVSDGISMGTDGMSYSLPSRDIIADSIETVMQAQWYDGLVAIPGCDKNMPGCLIAMGRLNRPALMVYGGTIKPGHLDDGTSLDIVSAFQCYGEYVAGRIDDSRRSDIVQPGARLLGRVRPGGHARVVRCDARARREGRPRQEVAAKGPARAQGLHRRRRQGAALRDGRDDDAGRPARAQIGPADQGSDGGARAAALARPRHRHPRLPGAPGLLARPPARPRARRHPHVPPQPLLRLRRAVVVAGHDVGRVPGDVLALHCARADRLRRRPHPVEALLRRPDEVCGRRQGRPRLPQGGGGPRDARVGDHNRPHSSSVRRRPSTARSSAPPAAGRAGDRRRGWPGWQASGR